MASDNPNASTFGAAMSRNPLGNSKFGTRSRPHCLLSEVSDAPWLLSGESENAANAASSFKSHGILCSPSLVNPKLIASVRAEAETALDAALSNPIYESAELCGLLRQPCCRYNVKLDLTPSIAACVRALRASRLAPVVALTLGREDAALVGLSCIVTKPGAKAQLASCETPASEQYARTAHQAALAQEGTRMVSIRLALCDIEYPMGALTVWPATHTPAFHEQAFGSESNNGGSGGAAMALRETPSVHMDLRAGDALLVDSRLWHADGANTTGGSGSSGLPNHAGPPRSQIVLIATFASPRLFPPPSECTMLPRLIGRFSLLNLEAALTSGDWVHEWPLVEGSKKTEDRRISLPEQSVVQLLDIARSMPPEEQRAAKCVEALQAALREAVEEALAAAPSTEPSAVEVSDADEAPAPASSSSRRVVRAPSAAVRCILMLSGGALQAPLRQQLIALLRAEPEDEEIVTREELSARWQMMHDGRYALSKTSEDGAARAEAAERLFRSVLAAAAAGKIEGVEAWLASGGSVDARGGTGRSTLLMKAAGHGHLELVEFLLSKSASPNLQDAQGSTALHAAAYMGHTTVVKSLLKAGASTDVRDADGETALDWANDPSCIELIEGQTFVPLIIPNLLEADQIKRLLELREIVTPVHDDGAGHEVIFLHAAMPMQPADGSSSGGGSSSQGELSPSCVQLLMSLADAMRTNDPRIGGFGEDLSVRCIELHTYHAGAGLMDRDHKDSGSALSMSVMLSEPGSFEGGEFLTWEGDTPIPHMAAQGQGVLFRSEDYHNVSPVKSGVRQVLVMELWVGETNRVDRNS